MHADGPLVPARIAAISMHSIAQPTSIHPEGQQPDSFKLPKVLIVDDDRQVTRVVMAHLHSQGMQAFDASNGNDMLRHLRQRKPDVILLDLVLGQEDGLQLLRELRRESNVPVIILSGYRRDEVDRVVGLELGADDYITKPFGLHELTARTRAVLRRSMLTRGAAMQRRDDGYYRFSDWTLDLKARTLLKAGIPEPVELTRGEFTLLRVFVDTPGQTLSRERLLEAISAQDDIYDRSIDVQILRLRRKLEDNPRHPQLLITRRGTGYLFTPQVERLL